MTNQMPNMQKIHIYIYSLVPTPSVLNAVDKTIRQALHEKDTALVDDLFIDLDVNKLHIDMVTQLETSTALYKAMLPNRDRFLVRAYKEQARKTARQNDLATQHFPVCPHCRITMSIGEALPPTSSGNQSYIMPQAPLKGDEVKLYKVFKCSSCGHSETLDEFGKSIGLNGIELTR